MAKIYYGMATYPPRKKCLLEVIPNIVPQCTKLFVYLNEYEDVPKILEHPKIKVIMGKDHGHCGDIGKFHFVDKVDGYYFTVDDDIIYPPDYTQRMVGLIDQYKQKVVVGVHGCVLNLKNMWNYYRARNLTNYRSRLDAPRSVHVIGTGTAAFHTSTIKLSRETFKEKNMADIWFALEGQKQRIPFVLIPRKAFWLNDSPTALTTTSIYRKSRDKKHGEYQTQVIREYGKWNLYR